MPHQEGQTSVAVPRGRTSPASPQAGGKYQEEILARSANGAGGVG